jgi:hypothetical protein
MEVKDLIRTQMPKGTNTTAILGNVAPLIERNVIVRVKRRGDCCVFELYAVLAVFNKHYNKWFMLGPNDTFPMFQQANSRKQTPTKSSSDDGNATSTTTTPITKNPSTKGKRKRKKDPEPTAATQEKKKKKLEPSFRLLIRMLYYDEGMTQFFKYAEKEDEGMDWVTRNDVFRLIPISQVNDVIGKLRHC